MCVQEIKCLECDVPRCLRKPRKAHASFHAAERKGYSGVALYSKLPHHQTAGFGHGEFDREGRYVWHCHILEHEDNEMMRPYVVRPAEG